MIVSVIQLNSKINSDVNLKKAVSLLEKSLEASPDIIVLPEYTNYLGPLEQASAHALPANSVWHTTLGSFAKKNSVGIIAGLLIETGRGKPASAALYFDKQGNVAYSYDKIHLFDMNRGKHARYRESDYIAAGDKITLCEIGETRCGCAVCFDLRFPELFRRLALKQARIIFIPSAFTSITGKAHWEILLRARAIENQVFIVASNQTGEIAEGKACFGMSMIVDPWGTVLAKAPAFDEEIFEGVISASLDFSYQDKIREQMPCLSSRREDLFYFPQGK